jgi:hypothetical protein
LPPKVTGIVRVRYSLKWLLYWYVRANGNPLKDNILVLALAHFEMKKSSLTPSLSDIIIAIVSLALLKYSLREIANDPGTGWHLATGQFILKNGWVPINDPFLADAKRWVADQWGADVLLALIFNATSWSGLAGCIFLTFTFCYFTLLLVGLRKITGSPLLALIVCTSAYKVAQIHFLIRPVVMSFLMFSSVYLTLIHLMELWKDGKKISPSKLLILPCLFTLWANLHPFFILGLVLVAIWPMSIFVCHFLDAESLEKDNLKLWTPISLLAACFAATLVNPYLWNLHLSILNLGASDFFMNYHMEWLSPDFDKLEGKLAEMITVTLIVAIFLNKPTISAQNIFHLLAAIVFAHGSLQAVRILPFYMIVLSVPWVEQMQQLRSWVAKIPVLRLLPQVENWEKGSAQGIYALTLSLILGIQLVAALPGINEPVTGPSVSKFPHDILTKFLDSQYVRNLDVANTAVSAQDNTSGAAHLNLAAPAHWGGFITFISSGRLRPVLDDRNTLVGERLYKEWHAAETDLPKMKALMQAHNSAHLLLPAKHPLVHQLMSSKEFISILKDDTAHLFFIRKDSQSE